MTRMWSIALASAALAATSIETVQNTTPKFPPRFEQYLTRTAKITAQQRTTLMGGAPVTTLLRADESKEVAVFGTIWIDAPMDRYVEAVKDIESFERGGGFKVTRRISPEPRLEYPKVTLPESTSFLYWQETVFGLKPAIRISHLTIREGSDDTVVTSKML